MTASTPRLLPFTALVALLAAVALPAQAAPMDLSAAVIATETTGAEPEVLQRVTTATYEAASRSALRMKANPDATEALLRAARMNPRVCAAAAPCVAKLGRRLEVRYVVALGVIQLGDTATLTFDLVDVQREAVIGHGETRWDGVTAPDLVVAEAVASALPKDLRNPMATITLVGVVEGAQVTLDGERIGTTPIEPTYVPPGEHVVLVEKPGYKEYRKRFEVEPGARLRLDAKLERLMMPDPPPLPQAAARVTDHSHVPIYVAAGTSLTALGTGLGLVLAIQSNERAYHAECSQAFGYDCTQTPFYSETERMKQLRAKIDTQDVLAGISFGVAGAAAVVTGVLLLLDPPHSPPARPRPDDGDELAARLQLQPIPRGAALQLAGSF